MSKDVILGLVRHILTAVGGYFTLKGIADEATVTAIVGGIVTIAGAVWSVIDKQTRSE